MASLQYSPPHQVRQRIQVRAPLPFNVRDHGDTLLPARGHVMQTTEQMPVLFARGALVELTELQRLLKPTEYVQQTRPGKLPGLWTQCLEARNDSLRSSAKEGFSDALQETAPAVLALAPR